MKSPILITAFTLLLIFSSTCVAEWTKVSISVKGTFYVDFDRIKQLGGYVYFWEMNDFVKPRLGDLSSKMYFQGDCIMFRLKVLSYISYKESSGQGTSESVTPPDKWTYPPPDSPLESILKTVCFFAKNR